MTTVFDVARRAGVSIATVSRVLRGSAIVSEQTRAQVVQAVEELGYLPNRMAQGLRLGKTETVAFAVGDIEQSVYSAITKHLQPALEQIGLDLLLYNLGHSEERLFKLLDNAAALGVRAVVIASSDALPEKELLRRVRILTQTGIDVVSVNQDLSLHGIPSVVYDDRAAAHASVSYLLANGNAHVAYLGRISGSAIGSNRYAGYLSAHEEAGIRFNPDLVWDASYRYPAGYEAVARACRDHMEFSAVQAGSDELAMGAMAALQDNGRGVPEDVKVVGFGGADWSEHTRPALSTLSSDPAAMADHVREIFEALNARCPPRLLTTMQRLFALRASA